MGIFGPRTPTPRISVESFRQIELALFAFQIAEI